MVDLIFVLLAEKVLHDAVALHQAVLENRPCANASIRSQEASTGWLDRGELPQLLLVAVGMLQLSCFQQRGTTHFEAIFSQSED